MAFTLFRERYAHYIISSLDARMGEVYWAAYHWNGNGFDCVAQPEVIAPDQVSLVNPVEDADWVGAGNGWQLLDQFSPVMQGLVQQTYPELLPQAGDIARLAELYWQQGKTVSAEDAIPVYLRDNVAFKKGEGPHQVK